MSRATNPIFMAVLAAQHTLPCRVGMVISRGRDVNEQSTRGVDPSRIDHIQLVRLFPIHIVRIDLQHVISAFWDPWCLVVEDSHVVVGREVVNGFFRDLDVGVGIPW